MIKDKKTGYIFKTTDYSIKEVMDGKDVLSINIPVKSEDAKIIANEMILVEQAYSNSEFVVKTIDGDDEEISVEAWLNTDYFREELFVDFNKTGSPYNILRTVVPNGWTVEDHTGIKESKTVDLQGATALDVADSVVSIFGISIRYDFERKQQHLYNPDSFKSQGEYLTKELNLVSMNRFSNTKELVNRLYARGKDGLTFSDINGGKDYVEDTTYLSGKVVSAFVKDDRFENKESLLEHAKEKLKLMCKPQTSYECNPVDIGSTNSKYAFLKFNLLSVVTLLDVERNTRIDHQVVERTVFPYDKNRNVLVLSTTLPTLTNETGYISDQIKNPSSDFNQKLQNDMDRIANAVLQASGGYVIINFGGDGKMAEILIMDTNDKKTAKDVMRLNKEGIAFSTSGYNGPFNGAWSLNGEFFTQFIATWKLAASTIVSGKLEDKTGKSYWDLDNGKLSMSGTFESSVGRSRIEMVEGLLRMYIDGKEIIGLANTEAEVGGLINLSKAGELFMHLSHRGIFFKNNWVFIDSGEDKVQTNVDVVNADKSNVRISNFEAVRPNSGQNTLYTNWKRKFEIEDDEFVLVGKNIVPNSLLGSKEVREYVYNKEV